jgi:acido-empty-quinoprotein group A
VNGVLYFSVPDDVWAVDARNGHELWHYTWPPNEGNHVGNRGVGIYGNWLYFMTPDDYLVCLNAKDGKKRWSVQIADVKANWFSTIAPMIVGNHIIVAPGNDDNIRSFIESRDPETGSLQWRWWVDPDPGEPGSETWPDVETMKMGGGNPWMPGTYDPELNLYYIGTGNGVPMRRPPHPALAGDSLYTASVVALNPNTGKMAWYFQMTPHDTHDWDAAQTPILFDGEFNGKKHKLLAQVNRNGYFFLLDRVTGEHLLTSKYMPETNWAKGIDSKGRPIPDYTKDSSPAGTLVSPNALGATNWFAPAFNPNLDLILVNGSRSYSFFTTAGFGRLAYTTQHMTLAIDYKTGKTVWDHELGDKSGSLISGLLSTESNLLFGGDTFGNALAMDCSTGRTLWHANVGSTVSNGPITYELDGRQYVVLAAKDLIFAFTLPDHDSGNNSTDANARGAK